MAKSRDLHVAFIGLKKAYDSMPRANIWKAMQKKRVKTGNRIASSFRTTKAVLPAFSN